MTCKTLLYRNCCWSVPGQAVHGVRSLKQFPDYHDIVGDREYEMDRTRHEEEKWKLDKNGCACGNFCIKHSIVYRNKKTGRK